MHSADLYIALLTVVMLYCGVVPVRPISVSLGLFVDYV